MPFDPRAIRKATKVHTGLLLPPVAVAEEIALRVCIMPKLNDRNQSVPALHLGIPTGHR